MGVFELNNVNHEVFAVIAASLTLPLTIKSYIEIKTIPFKIIIIFIALEP